MWNTFHITTYSVMPVDWHSISCFSCVFQMILWDWDLKHWYKPQYQVSTVFFFCSSFILSMPHIHNTGRGFCIQPVIAAYKSPLGHSVPFPDNFLVWLNTHCVKLGILWPCNRRHATFFILLRHSLSCLNYSCNLSKNLTDTDQKSICSSSTGSSLPEHFPHFSWNLP